MEYNILDHHLKNNNYILLLSGLESSPIHTVAKELCIAFNGIVLDFMHLTDMAPLNDRINDIKNQFIVVKSKSFPKDEIKFRVDLHYNVSIKTQDKEYLDSLKTNYINKYFNFKADTDIDITIDTMFNLIIDDLEKKVYKKDYDTLNHKVFTGEKASRLVSDPKSKSIKEQREEEYKAMESELEEEYTDDDSSDSDEDMLSDSVMMQGEEIE